MVRSRSPVKPRQTQPGLTVGAVQEIVAERFNLAGDFFEQVGDLAGRIIADFIEGVDGGAHRAIHLRFRGVMKGQLSRLLAARVNAVEDVSALGGCLAGDVVMSSQLHRIPSILTGDA